MEKPFLNFQELFIWFDSVRLKVQSLNREGDFVATFVVINTHIYSLQLEYG